MKTESVVSRQFYFGNNLEKTLIEILEIIAANKTKYQHFYLSRSQSSATDCFYLMGSRDYNLEEQLADKLKALADCRDRLPFTEKSLEDHKNWILKYEEEIRKLKEQLSEKIIQTINSDTL